MLAVVYGFQYAGFEYDLNVFHSIEKFEGLAIGSFDLVSRLLNRKQHSVFHGEK